MSLLPSTTLLFPLTKGRVLFHVKRNSVVMSSLLRVLKAPGSTRDLTRRVCLSILSLPFPPPTHRRATNSIMIEEALSAHLQFFSLLRFCRPTLIKIGLCPPLQHALFPSIPRTLRSFSPPVCESDISYSTCSLSRLVTEISPPPRGFVFSFCHAEDRPSTIRERT